jgi:hypothetical protein
MHLREKPMTDYANASDLTTREEAKDQHPELDESAAAASETETPESDVVFAQTPEEVEAQIKNRAAGAVDPEAGEAGLEARGAIEGVDEAEASEADFDDTADDDESET